MLQHFLLFLWLSNRLPPCPAVSGAWEEHVGPGGRKLGKRPGELGGKRRTGNRAVWMKKLHQCCSKSAHSHRALGCENQQLISSTVLIQECPNKGRQLTSSHSAWAEKTSDSYHCPGMGVFLLAGATQGGGPPALQH